MSDSIDKELLAEKMKEAAKDTVLQLQKSLPGDIIDTPWDKIEEGLAQGKSIKEICNYTDEQLEDLKKEGMEFFSRENYGEAGSYFLSLCLYDPGVSGNWLLLAQCFESLEKYKEALTAYQTATVIAEGVEPLPYLGMGFCSLCLGDSEGAKEYLEAGKELCFPDKFDGDGDLVESFDKLLSECQ